jgi:hypothetical protein
METGRGHFPPGWYPDQQGSGYRYWDGGRWTDDYLRPGEDPRSPKEATVTPAEQTDTTPPGQRARGAISVISILAGVAAIVLATSLPHSAEEVLVSGGPYLKEGYYMWLLLGGGGAIVLGVSLALMTAVRSRSGWVGPLTAATALLGLLIAITAAGVVLAEALADDEGSPAAVPVIRLPHGSS